MCQILAEEYGTRRLLKPVLTKNFFSPILLSAGSKSKA